MTKFSKINPVQFLLKMIVVITIFSGIMFSCGGNKEENETPSIYAKQNLIAWCIVPYDSEKRGSEERAQMLKELGITKLAYDWRDEHIPTFDHELKTLKKHNIKLQGFWLASDPDPANDKNLKIILDALQFILKNKMEGAIGGI